jgi:hypothetical protein
VYGNKSLDADVRNLTSGETLPLNPSNRTQLEALLENQRRGFPLLVVRDSSSLSAGDRVLIWGRWMALRKQKKVWILHGSASYT